jgi:hypothetical protein
MDSLERRRSRMVPTTVDVPRPRKAASTNAAVFDVGGTLTRTTILDPLVWYQRSRFGFAWYAAWAMGLYLRAPYYLLLDRLDRGSPAQSASSR